MKKEDLVLLIEVRKRLIDLYNHLDSKHESMAVIQQKVVAEELLMIIMTLYQL